PSPRSGRACRRSLEGRSTPRDGDGLGHLPRPKLFPAPGFPQVTGSEALPRTGRVPGRRGRMDQATATMSDVHPSRDLALIDRLAGLYPAVVSEELDREGHRHQVMAPSIRPLSPEAGMAGYAMPVHAVPAYSMPDEPYRMELAAVDHLQPGDVMVVSTIEG